MTVFRWIKDRLTIRDIEPWRVLYGHDADSGESVTPDTALKLSAWWACTRLISETIATLPYAIYRKNGEDRAVASEHPCHEIMLRPNPDQTSVEFWEGRVAPLCSEGNSYAEKRFVGDRLVSLEPLRVDKIEPVRDDNRRLVYRVTDRGKTEELAADKVFHVKGFGIDEDKGLSPVAFAARSIGGALSADRAASRLNSKGLRAAGFWKPPVEMDATQRQQVLGNYVKLGAGLEGQGKSIIVPPGFGWESFGITPKDAELLMQRGFNVADVCRWMGVPPILVGHASEGQTMWGSGVEQIILGWLILGLRAYLKRIEAAVNKRVLTRADVASGYYFEFNFEGLLRADSAGRAQLMSTLAQNGLRTRNELRRLDNQPAMPGGDNLTVQSNLVPIAQLGAAQQNAENVRNAMRTWLLDERETRNAA